MIEQIVSYSIHNKLIILVFVAAMVGWGIYSIFHIPLGTVPDITNNQVQVITTSRNLATEDIEQFITFPIELEMGNLPGVQEIRSISKFGLSVVTVIFDDDMGTYLPRQLIAEKLKSAQEKIPAHYGIPDMGPISTGLGEIYQYILDVKPGYESMYSTMDLRTIQDWVVKRQLIGIPGVVEVNTWGGFLKQYEVAVQPERLHALNVTIREVFEALEGNNENAGGGYIEKYQESYFVRGEGLIRTLTDIENIVVKVSGNVPILIRDVGYVRMGHANRFGAITGNGKGEKVMGQIMMLKGANSGDVIKRVKERVAEVQKSLPDGIFINPVIERTELINKTTATITENLTLGALIVIFIVVLVLGNLRSGFIVASIIPLSLLFALGCMNALGISADLMSLGAIDFGIIIDGAVIIVEFVLYQFTRKSIELSSLTNHELQEAKDRITKDASNRMLQSAFFGQIIILIVFIPILSLGGIEGKMFIPMALSFSFAITGSIILCLTYVPAISALLLKPETHLKPTLADRLLGFMQRVYRPTLLLALHYRKATIGLALLLFVAGLLVFDRLGGEFVPTLDEGDYVVQPILRPGTSLSENIAFCTRIEQILISQFPEVTQVVSRIGAAEVPTDPMSLEMSDIIVRLKPKKEWVSARTKEELADKMKTAMSVFPGIEFEFTQPIEMRFNELITGVRADVAIKIFGEDIQLLYDQAVRIRGLIRDVKGVADISVEQVVGLPQMTVEYDRQKLARYGVNVSQVNDIIQTAFAGKTASTVLEGERRFDLVLRFDMGSRESMDDLKRIMIDLPAGGRIPVTEIANIDIKRGPAQISRENTRRRIVIGINVRNRDLESMVDEVRGIIESNISLPEGYHIRYGGQFENLQLARARLKLVVPVSLALIFLMLYFAFRSVTQVFMILSAVPLATIGGVFLLWIRGMPFSISAGIGFIALFGISTLNGIVLISYFNELKAKGETDVTKRILEGTKSRLRPVILTAAAAALGFFPMAISTSAGAEVQRPLATVVIGGLFTATLLTLIVLPVIYKIIYDGHLINRLGKYGLRIVLILCTIGLINVPLRAQSQVITLEEAILLAKQNNLELKNAMLQIEGQSSLLKTAWSLGQTEVNYMRGNINTRLDDYNWVIRQDFGSPFYQNSMAGFLKSQILQSEAASKLISRNIELETGLAYLELQWRQRRFTLIERNYRQYSEAVRIADLKYESGESNLLSKVMMEAEFEELRLVMEQEDARVVTAREGLKKMLQTETDFLAVQADTLAGIKRPFQLDSLIEAYNGSAELYFLQSGRQASEQNIRLQKSAISPSLGFSVFTQSIEHEKGYDGWELSLRFPLWFRPNSGEIQSAKIQYEMVSNAVDRQQFSSLRDLASLNNLRNNLIDRIQTYERTALRNAYLIMENAELLYRNGEIEYMEYTRGISQAINMQLNYLDNLYELDQVTRRIEFTIR